MTFRQLLLIVLCYLIRKDIEINCENTQSEVGNNTDINSPPAEKENTEKCSPAVSHYLNNSLHANIAELYNFSILNNFNAHDKNKTESQLIKKSDSNTVNVADLYDFSSAIVENKTPNAIIFNESKSKEFEPFGRIGNIAGNHSFTHRPQKELNKFLLQNRITTKSPLTTIPSVIGNLAELYFFSAPTVMGMFNCSYENTINITKYPMLTNGSYIYDDVTIISPDLIGNYDYEILYNRSRRSVAQHKRACICQLKRCITLCSGSIIDFYQDVIESGESVDNDLLNVFSIKMTMENKTVVTKNIAKDFAHIVLNDFCEMTYTLSSEEDEKSGWTLFENGTLLRHSDQVQLTKMEYCFDLYEGEANNKTHYVIMPLNCAKNGADLEYIVELIYWGQVISLPFFLLTITTYCCLPELHNVYGKCFMTYLCSVTTSYCIISYINLSQKVFDTLPCLLMAYLNHYMELSHYTWLFIMCFDTWKSFSDHTYMTSYHKYAMYGYHLPLLMTFLTFLAQNMEIDEDLKPGISEYRCGLDADRWSAAIYLYGPCLIILICCLVSFISISKIIKNNDREVYKVNELKYEYPRARYALYLQLFIMMGLSWFLDVMSYFLNMFNMIGLSRMFDYINSLQGVCIFVNLVGRKRVRNIIREKFSRGERFKQRLKKSWL